MGEKSINDIYTVYHALSHGIGGKYSFFQEDGELARYHHRYIDQARAATDADPTDPDPEESVVLEANLAAPDLQVRSG